MIEANGVTSLTQVGSNYFLYNSGAGPQLNYNGTAVVEGQIPGWAPIAAEQISGGYQVVWKANGADQYTIWTTDSSGNFVSYIPAMWGSNSVLKSAEMTFQQDLNSDGVIGNPSVVIESSGVTSLTQVGSNYYLYNSGAGPQLKYGGTAVVVGQIAGWAPIAGEQISGGYQVVWKANGADQYTLWTTDSNGSFVSYIPAMSGSSSVLKSAETTFQQDLNGDGLIGGTSNVVIELAGSTSLTQVGNNYYLYTSGAGPQLKYGGTAVVAGQIAGWAPIAGEQISGGYQVVWKANGADLYTLWTTDSNGNFVSYVPAMSGSSSVLKSAETTFQQDLNGDGLIGGTSNVVIELAGSTSLTQVGNNYYLYTSGAGPQLKYGGTAVVAGQISGWAPIAGEQISGGYQVVWKANGADLYTLWTTDSNGNFVSYIPAMSGSSSVLKNAETTFQQDLNGDGVLNSAPAVGQIALSPNLAAPDDAGLTAGNGTFVFASNHSAPTNDAGVTAPDDLPANGRELALLVQEAQSQHIAFQWIGEHGLGGTGGFASVIPTDVEVAGLHAKGFIFH